MSTVSDLDVRKVVNPPRVAARILAADLACLGHEVAAAIRSGADLIHMDVMEEERAPRSSVGPLVCAALRRVTGAPFEAHLMVKPADDFVAAFASAGAEVITFHPEASEDVRRSVMRVKERGCKVGLALNPSTPLSVLDRVLEDLDQVLFMWASPGGCESERFPTTLRKIRALRERVSSSGRDVAISVDGGVGFGNAEELLRAGANSLVVESALCHTGDRAGTIAVLKGMAPPPPPPASGSVEDPRHAR